MPSLASLLERKLEPQLATLLKHTGQAAADAGMDAYVVGGLVRDLVLGAEPRDPDIVVVGQASTFAVRLAGALGGQAGTPSEFGTITLTVDGRRVDIATARAETYAKPGALPAVTPAGIEEDLRRRDFSVNAMAVSIWPDSFGQLIDPASGFSDCSRRRLRVLHLDSFADDPTRAIRAARYLVRLDFQLESATAEALERDLHHMQSVSAARVRAELEKLLAEPRRVEMIRMADQLGVLAAIEPSLRPGSAGLTALEAVEDGRPTIEYLAYVVASLTENEVEALIRRLDPPREWREIISAAPRLRGMVALLSRDDLTPSEIVDLLDGFPVEALQVQERLSPPTPLRKNLRDYLQRFRSVKPELTGDDLISVGAKEGPMIGRLLDELRSARLDGKVHSRDEELELAKRRISAS